MGKTVDMKTGELIKEGKGRPEKKKKPKEKDESVR